MYRYTYSYIVWKSKFWLQMNVFYKILNKSTPIVFLIYLYKKIFLKISAIEPYFLRKRIILCICCCFLVYHNEPLINRCNVHWNKIVIVSVPDLPKICCHPCHDRQSSDDFKCSKDNTVKNNKIRSLCTKIKLLLFFFTCKNDDDFK